ncbi:beta strand repeat-containing protein [Aquisphaera insulae]|uniref:beta strand repeat-containing protein n=1 Tax=Aquisphaera insulae TaxID=2712864 RepID=UPI0013EC880A|nr:right-handed parallel beta-helix repeat-containing protein [Aquisphaera insulae]
MFGTRPQAHRHAPRRRGYRPLVLDCEARLLLAVIPVTTTADFAEPGSLRYALSTSESGDEIVFQIPTNDNGYNPATQSWTITVLTPLPTVFTSFLTIDGLSQQSQTGASTTHPAIEITPGPLASGDGLKLIGGHNVIRGLVLNEFSGHGLSMSGSGADGNLVTGNYIGTDVTGTVARPNAESGILVASSSNTIGGTAASQRNVVSGNGGDGITIQRSGGNSATNNTLLGNFVGTNATGTAALGNAVAGLRVQTDSNTVGGLGSGGGNLIAANRKEGAFVQGGANTFLGNLIGTNAAGATGLGNGLSGITLQDSATNTVRGNVISGNGVDGGSGIAIVGSGAQQNAVQGNLIGLNPAGTAAVANGGPGVLLFDQPSRNLIGGTGAGDGNVISGNQAQGIDVESSNQNTIQNNAIGTDAARKSAVPNSVQGIEIVDSSGTIVRGNLISGNGTSSVAANGIRIRGSGSTKNLIESNFIGTDGTGQAAIPNANDGIVLTRATVGNTLSGNLISGNGRHGIEVDGADVQGTTITDNRIGLNLAGDAALGNHLDGILIGGASNTTVGPGNIISGNGTNGEQGAGVNITGSGASGNVVQGNLIGTDATGTRAVGNSSIGVFLGDGSVSNIIGPGNVITGNGAGTDEGVGVYVYGPNSTGNQVLNNRIGTDASGLNGLQGSVIGVLVNGSPSNLIRGNQVSGNRIIGVEIAGATASANRILGNFIGLDSTGGAGIGNGFDGIFINNAPSNLIGGPASGDGNFIAASGSVGVQLFGSGATGNIVQGNALGLNVSGRPTLPNRRGGIFVNTTVRSNTIGGRDSGEPNSGQATPIVGAVATGRTASVAVTAVPPAARKFRRLARSYRTAPRPHRG